MIAGIHVFGSIYADHPDALLESLYGMNAAYRQSSWTSHRPAFIFRLQRVYLRMLGVPEIGFRLRGVYFARALRRIASAQMRDLLDAGCGIGAYAFWLARSRPDAMVVGWDTDDRKVSFARQLLGELRLRNASFAHQDVTSPDGPEDSFDLILSIDVLEHIPDPLAALKNFQRLLRPGGYLYVHAPRPNQRRIFRGFDSWHHEDHVREGIAPDDLVSDLRALGFRILEARPTFGPFGKVAWELNHMALRSGPVVAAASFPVLYGLARLDPWGVGKGALGTAVLAQKSVTSS